MLLSSSPKMTKDSILAVLMEIMEIKNALLNRALNRENDDINVRLPATSAMRPNNCSDGEFVAPIMPYDPAETKPIKKKRDAM